MVVWQLNYLKLEDLLVNSSKSRYLKATGGKQNTFLQFELSLDISGMNSTLLMFFCQYLGQVLPQRKSVRPGLSFLFELVLLRGTCASSDLVVGWAAFPMCENNFCLVEGKFKCPLLRGNYDWKLDSFRKIEDLICQDLDQWLCNLYFKVCNMMVLFINLLRLDLVFVVQAIFKLLILISQLFEYYLAGI